MWIAVFFASPAVFSGHVHGCRCTGVELRIEYAALEGMLAQTPFTQEQMQRRLFGEAAGGCEIRGS